MEKAEFLEKAKAAGFSEEDIRDAVEEHEDAEKDGILLPYDVLLMSREEPLVY